MSNFIVEFPLTTEPFQMHILNKRLEISRKIYNSLVVITQKRYKEMIKTRKYRELKQLKDANSKKELYQLYKEFGITEFSFHADVKKLQKHFKSNIDSHTSQKIATRLWKSYEKLIFSNGEKIHFKKFEQCNSVEGKSNKSGIRFTDGKIKWLKLELPVEIDHRNQYEMESLRYDISYCRIVRKYVRCKCKYYVQLILKGSPPKKCNYKTGELKHSIGSGDVGIDIGTQTVAIASDNNVKLLELADRVQIIENKKHLLLRKLDRSKRAMNPNNFNNDGTIKNQGSKKVTWLRSKRYMRIQLNLRELYRKQAAIRKYQHECLANEIINLGDNIYVETMNFKGLQRRSKKTELNSKGKFKRKKRFGKSLANKAPSMFLTILDRKLKKYNTNLIKIDTFNTKASQYDHIGENYKKKKLSQRWVVLENGMRIQRDMYSAFLIMNTNENDLKSFNQTKCESRFEKFKTLHDLEVQRLQNTVNLSSMAI